MSARYVFKVGPKNRHPGYAQPVTANAENFSLTTTQTGSRNG